MELFNDYVTVQDERNQIRKERYYRKLLDYYGGTFPMEYHRRVNKGRNKLMELRAKWREKETLPIQRNASILPDNVIAFKQTA